MQVANYISVYAHDGKSTTEVVRLSGDTTGDSCLVELEIGGKIVYVVRNDLMRAIWNCSKPVEGEE